MKKKLLSLIILSACILASALPDAGTQRSGNLCERAHTLEYNYEFSYTKEMVSDEEYDFTIFFFIHGLQVTSKPYTLKVEIQPKGFIVNESSFNLKEKKTIKIKPIKEDAALLIKTTLTLNGDAPAHRHYKATYVDSFTLKDFVVLKDLENISWSTTTTRVSFEKETPSKVPWYIVRVTGLIAYVLLSFSVMSALFRKLHYRRPAFLLRRHCDISYLALVFAFMHAINNLLDRYAWSLSLLDVFWFNYSSRFHIMLSLGVLSLYAMAFIALSSLTPKSIAYIKSKRWRIIHLTSYTAYVAVIVHSSALGTDLGNAPNNPLTYLILGVYWVLAAVNFLLLILLLTKKVKER